MKKRAVMTHQASELIAHLLDNDPRIAVLVSGTFLEKRLLTLLTSRLKPKTSRRERMRKFLDGQLTLADLMAIGNILDEVPRKYREDFDLLMKERNRIAHHYMVWRKLGKKRKLSYRQKWGPYCESVAEFLDTTTGPP